MKGPRRRLRALLLLLAGASLTSLVLVAYATGLLAQSELDTVDARFSIRGVQQAPRDLLIVNIDDATFDELGVQWPFPRDLHAKVLDRLRAGGARAIAYDVQFTEPSADTAADNALIAAVARARGRVVLATSEVNEFGETKVLGGERRLRQTGARAANGLLRPDADGIDRRVDNAIDDLETLAVATVESATGRQVPAGRIPAAGAWIDFHGPPGTIADVSFSDVLRGRVPRDALAGRIVVVGASAPSLQDVHPTSASGDRLMSGAEIHANAIDTVRRGVPLKSAPGWLEVAIIVLLGLLPPLAQARLRLVAALAVAVGAAVAYAGLAQLAFNAGTILPFTYPIAAVAVSSVATLCIAYAATSFERERVRDLFRRFVPEGVVDEALALTGEGSLLGGRRLQSTVLFCDLRGFTSFAELVAAERVIEVLNRYLGEMSDAILAHDGTVVSYAGDGIMAVFGAPVEQPDHADRAVEAAREMLEVRLPRFNGWLREEGPTGDFRVGIGINSGTVMSGHVGSERRLEYTVIGDTTNTAARLEAMTKDTPHQILISDTTRSMLRRDAPDLLYLDAIAARGKRVKVNLWTLAAGAGAGDVAATPAERIP